MAFRTGLAALLCLGLSFAPLAAQTSGATAPEITQFEPVDTTDLVNLATGDLAYSLPVMSIPGAPGGAYPLALNYHAGVLYDQEASWVGLGWNLSPGAISRAVRGEPDDLLGGFTNRTGQQKIYSYSLGVSYAGFNAGVNWDTNGGYGGSVGYSFVQANYTVNHAGTHAGIGVSHKMGALSVGAGYNTSGEVNAEAGLNAGGVGFSVAATHNGHDGTSITSGISIRGQSRRVYSNKKPPVSSVNAHTKTLAAVSILYFSFGYSKTTVRSYGGQKAYGILHTGRVGEKIAGVGSSDNLTKGSGVIVDNDEFDTGFTGLDTISPVAVSADFYVQDYTDSKRKGDEDYQHGATIESDYFAPAYDNYTIAAQGVSGQLQPIMGRRGFIKPQSANFSYALDDDYVFYPYQFFYQKLQGELGNTAGIEVEAGDYFNHYALDGGLARGRWIREVGDGSEPNMMLINDPGYLSDSELYGNPNTAIDPENNSAMIANRSTRVRYELDDVTGAIARIIVVKPDGLRYIFGQNIVPTNNPEARVPELKSGGAVPYNREHFQSTATTEGRTLNYENGQPAGQETISETNTLMTSSPYAWYLAAIESPDYRDADSGVVGAYDPEDYGSYIVFRYALVEPSFRWEAPFGVKALYDANDKFTGYEEVALHALNGKDQDRGWYVHERQEGVKSIWVPYRAETKSHVAVFDIGENGERLDHRSGDVPVGDTLVYKFGPAYRHAVRAIEVLNAQQLADLMARPELNGLDNPNNVLMMPMGYARQMGVDVPGVDWEPQITLGCIADDIACEEYCPSDVVPDPLAPGANPGPESTPPQETPLCNMPGFYCSAHSITPQGFSMDYLGSLDYLDYDVFYSSLNLPQQLGCGNGTRYTIQTTLLRKAGNLVPERGHTQLNGIRLYERDVYEHLVKPGGASQSLFSMGQPVNLVNNTDYLIKVGFEYDYLLGKGMPNSLAPDGKRLTLTGVKFYSRNNVQGNRGYSFDYYSSDALSEVRYLEPYHKDPWGYLSKQSTPEQSFVDYTTYPTGIFFDHQAPFTGLTPIQAIWSLKNIDTPVGTRISIEYESDRYNWVQDRPAIVANAENLGGETLIRSWRQSGPDCTIPPSYDDLEILMGSPDGTPRPYNEFLLDMKQNFTLTDTVSNSTQYIAALVTSPGGEQIDRFILPITGTDQMYWLEDHQSVRDLYLKLSTRAHYEEGPVCTTLQLWTLKASDGELIEADHVSGNYDGNKFYKHSGHVGELGGGLRVKALTMSEGSMFTGNYFHRLEYDYKDPETGRNSGVIFIDPPRASQRRKIIGENSDLNMDARHIRSEYYPYFNFPGGNVTYADVAMYRSEQSNTQTDLGKMSYRFFTPRDLVFHAPASAHVNGGSVEVVSATTSGVTRLYNGSDPTLDNFGGYRFKKVIDIPPRWEVEYTGEPITLTLQDDVRKKVINNTALLGQLKTVKSYKRKNDATPFTETRSFYEANWHNPNVRDNLGDHVSTGNAPLLKRYSLTDASGGYRLEEEELQDQAPGVMFNKSQSLFLHTSDVNSHPYVKGRIFMLDEIFNTFRQQKTVTIEYGSQANIPGLPVRHMTTENEVLALDYYTGTEVLTSNRASGIDPTGSNLPGHYTYVLNVPAHHLGNDAMSGATAPWNPDDSGSLRSMNMLTQKGFSLTGVSSNPIGGVGFLDAADLKVTGAGFNHWSRLKPDGVHDSWFNDSAYSFVHADADKTSGGWRYPPLHETSSAGLLVSSTLAVEGGGKWQSAGQNTKYDAHGNVLEYRSFRNVFSAADTIMDGKLISANFTNAQKSQVFHQGFEDSGGPMPVWNDSGSGTDYMNLFDTVYTGLYSHTGVYNSTGDSRFTVPGTSYGSVAEDPRNQWWLSFYVKRADGLSTVAVTIGGNTQNVDLAQASAAADLIVQPVEKEWTLVRLTTGANHFTIDPGTAGLIDDIAMFPAEYGQPTDLDYRASAQCSLFAYHPYNRQVISITDARGRTLRFQYNAKGELWRAYDIKGRVQTEHYKSYYGQRLDGIQPAGQ